MISSLLNEGYDKNIKVSKGLKSKIYINNKEYIDLSFCAGTLLLGHNSKIYKNSLKKLANNNVSNFAMPNVHADKMANLLRKIFKKNKKFIFCNTGSESVLKSIRIAKAVSKKDLIISVSGSWHGSLDQFLFMPDKEFNPQSSSSGISNFYKKNLKYIPYNDIKSSKMKLDKIKSKIAAIIIEPIQACLPTEDSKEYLIFLDKYCKKNKIILIFDETITGLRTFKGSVQDKFNLDPSITTFGKCIGGGAPIGAIGLSKKFINQYKLKKKKVYFGGTFSGNSMSTFVGYNTIKYILKNKKILKILNLKAEYVRSQINNFIIKYNLNAKVYGFESMLRIVFSKDDIINRSQRDFLEKDKLKNVIKFKNFVFKNKIYYPSNGIIFISSETTYSDCRYIISVFKKGLFKYFK